MAAAATCRARRRRLATTSGEAGAIAEDGGRQETFGATMSERPISIRGLGTRRVVSATSIDKRRVRPAPNIGDMAWPPPINIGAAEGDGVGAQEPTFHGDLRWLDSQPR